VIICNCQSDHWAGAEGGVIMSIAAFRGSGAGWLKLLQGVFYVNGLEAAIEVKT